MSPAMPSSRSRRSASTSSPSRIRSPALSWITRSAMLSHSGVAYSGWLPTSRYSRAPLRRNTLLLRPQETTRRNRYLATSSGDSRLLPRKVQVTPYSFSRPKMRLSMMRSAYARPTSGSPLHGDVLRLGELQQAVVAPLPSQPGLLDPAERRRRVGHDAAVDADHAGLQRLADPQRPPQVGGVEVGDQAVLRVVGPADHVRLVGEPHHRGHRPEDLGAEDGRARGDAQDGGQVVVPAPVRGAAAGDDLAAGVGRLGDQGGDLAAGVLVDQRAEVGALLQARADGQLLQPGRELRG